MDSRREQFLSMDNASLLNASTSFSTALNSSFRNQSTLSAFAETQNKLKLLIEAFQRSNAENEALLDEISKFLSGKLELNQAHFSPETKDLLRKMSIAKEEGLADFSKRLFQICVGKKAVEDAKQRRQEKLARSQYETIFKNYEKFQEKSCKLSEALYQLSYEMQSANESDSSNKIVLQNRLGEYEKGVQKLEVELENMDWRQNHPNVVLGKSKKYLGTQGILADLDKDLQRFEGLPPDLLEAKALLGNKKSELERLNYEFKRKLTL